MYLQELLDLIKDADSRHPRPEYKLARKVSVDDTYYDSWQTSLFPIFWISFTGKLKNLGDPFAERCLNIDDLVADDWIFVEVDWQNQQIKKISISQFMTSPRELDRKIGKFLHQRQREKVYSKIQSQLYP